DAVERRDALAGPRASDDDATPVQLGEVERMRGLPELVQDVVTRVDDVVDRAAADGLDASHEPVGARGNLDVTHHDAHEAIHETVLIDAHAHRARLRFADVAH